MTDSISIGYALYVARLQRTGSIALTHQELPAPVDEFRRGLRRAAKDAGIRVLTSSKDESFIAWDPAFEVSMDAMREAMNSLDFLVSTNPTCPDDLVAMRDAPTAGPAPNAGAASRSPRRSPPNLMTAASPGFTVGDVLQPASQLSSSLLDNCARPYGGGHDD